MELYRWIEECCNVMINNAMIDAERKNISIISEAYGWEFKDVETGDVVRLIICEKTQEV